jgi:glycosyltransferase involved in cell wall biosynthesis
MSRKIKILILSHISELLGGAERSMLDVFEYLRKNYDVEAEFILREPLRSLAPELTKRSWKYHPVDFTFWSDGKPPETTSEIRHNAIKNLKAIHTIENLIEEIKPDLVATNSIVSPWAAIAAHNKGIPHVWFVREYGDLDHGRIFEIGRDKTFEDVGNLSALVVTNSETLAIYVRQYIEGNKVESLYNPFNVKEIEEKAAQKVHSPFKHNDSLKLVLTGNIARSKGQLEAIQAVGLLKSMGSTVELCLIGKSGDQEFSKELESEVAKSELKNYVHFSGYQENPLALVSHADVGIMPSRMEAFGRVTFEYLVAGKPIVGANSGATPEMVKDNINGYLYTPGNAESLANAVKHYVDNKQLINKHGQASKQIAKGMMAGKHNIDELYKKMVEATNAARSEKPINYFNRLEEYEVLIKQGNKETYFSRTGMKILIRRIIRAVYVRIRRLLLKLKPR